MADAPVMAPYARHIFFCTGRFCDPQRQGEMLYKRLPELLGSLGNYENSCRVKRGIAACLGVCAGGPIVVVYPDGIWYHHVDEALLNRIVEEHLRQNRPVVEAIFHILPGDLA